MRIALIMATALLCSAPAHAAERNSELIQQLSERDYTDVRVIDRKRRLTVVEACRDGRQFKLDVDRQGEVTKRVRLGWCRDDVAEAKRRGDGRVAGWRRFKESDLTSKRRLKGQDCQDLLTFATEETDILFRSESADLSPNAHPMLHRIALVLSRCPGARLEVAGHTDSDGSRDLNQTLSERRAKAVAEFLVRDGVKLDRIETVGYGQDRPRSRDKALNRRIEFVLDWDA
jgi:outer membrane protein OmpA-like peptidoglycan-associated protein